jgi:integrase
VSDSTAPSAAVKPSNAKPDKPYSDFPLFAQGSTTQPYRWCKKIRGRRHYFGYCRDGWQAALNLYLEQRDDLYAGREPRDLREGGIDLGDLCGLYLEAKENRVTSGELSSRSLKDCTRTCDRIVGFFGSGRPVTDLIPSDFELFRSELAKGMASLSLGIAIQRTRSIFKWGYEQSLIENPVRFGNFRKSSTSQVRRERAALGRLDFQSDEIRTILSVASVQMRAMMLLGINCGFGQTDCAAIGKSSVDLDKGWHYFARPKTGIERKCPLWPETVAAMQLALDDRIQPKSQEDSDLFFVTSRGGPWVKVLDTGNHNDAVTKAFRKLQTKCGLVRERVGFYSLRRTFETVGGATTDQVAVNFIMGHAPSSTDMAAIYRQTIFEDRIVAVSDYVRKWLFHSL